MMFQVAERNGDYIVEAYIIEDANSTRGYWHPLWNFGCRQGDAFLFRDCTCPKLTDAALHRMVKAYKDYEARRSDQQTIENYLKTIL